MRKNFLYKKIVTLILVLSFIVPVAFLATPQKAQALDLIGGFANVIAAGSAAISATADSVIAVSTGSLTFKEFVLDALTSMAGEILIRKMTTSIVNWINGGFEGEPAFITNLGGFMTNVGDEVLGEFILKEGGSLAKKLCSAFSVDVRIAIALDYYASDKEVCTLTDMLGNIDDAFGNLSSRSAWDQWYELSINPHNNAAGSFLSSRNSVRLEQANKQDVLDRVLGWGDGFQSYEICDDAGTSESDPTAPVLSGTINNTKFNCRISTPGTVINNQLNNALKAGQTRLELADEINEILGALLGQLTTQIFGGSEGGLSGVSKSSYGRPSYIDQILQENINTSGITGKSLEVIDNNLADNNKYRSAKQTSLDAVKSAAENVEELYQCYIGKAAQKRTLWGIVGEGDKRSVVSFTSAELISNANSASSTISSTLVPLRDKLYKDILDVDDITSKLIILKVAIKNTTSPEDLTKNIDEYQTLQQGGKLKTIKGIYDAELERDGYPGEQHGLAKGIVRDMATLNNQTSASLEICQSLVLTQRPFISFGN